VDLAKYRTLFVDEASDHLIEMSRALADLESAEPGSPSDAAVDTLFRMTHSIKGMAASLEYVSVSTLAHKLEDWLEPLRRAGTRPADLELVHEAVRALEAMVVQVSETGEDPPSDMNILVRLQAPPVIAARVVRPAAAQRAELPAPEMLDLRTPPAQRSVRVRAEAVDRFLASVGDLMQRQARIEVLHRGMRHWELPREFTEELAAMERVVRELRRRALEIRTTPVRRLLERLPGTVGKLARSLGKNVRVELAGEEVEVDRAVLDHLDEPLLHLVRNAIDHGIESPEERRLAGKPPAGLLRVSASRAAGRLELCIEDDGRGLDVTRVRQLAVERGMFPQAVAEDLSPERVCELLFEPGMSTSKSVSEVSGRGVGLDAVKRTVEGLGGSIVARAMPGKGMRFELDLPSMVALQRVLILWVHGHRVALPVNRVDRVIDVKQGELERIGSEIFFMFEDEPIPLLDLGEHLGLGVLDTDKGGNIVLLEMREFRLGLLIDRAAADQEVFVREVPPVLDGRKELGGVAVLPDGTPVFLLEIGVLVEQFH